MQSGDGGAHRDLLAYAAEQLRPLAVTSESTDAELRLHCPFCDPTKTKRTSFAYNTEKGAAKCHKCEWSGGALATLKEFGIPPPPRTCASRKHVYRDADGEPLYAITIKKWSDGERQSFTSHWDGSHWQRKLAPEGTPQEDRDRKKVLYNLHRLVQVRPGDLVVLTEGEKDADRLADHGLHATSAPFGAKAKWFPQYTQTLRGHNVRLLPDADVPGRNHVRKVARALHGHAARVRVLELPDVREGGDVSDWLAAGHTIEELQDLIQTATDWDPAADPGDEPDPVKEAVRQERSRIRILSVDEVKTLRPPQWIVQDYLATECLSLLFGPPGSFKSFLALDWACRVAAGLGERQGPVLYAVGEAAGGLSKRISAWQADHPGACLDRLWFMDSLLDLSNAEDSTDLLKAVRELEEPPILIIIDTLARFFMGEENSNADTGRLVRNLNFVQRKLGGASTLLIHHTTKANPHVERGASALRGAADIMIAARPLSDVSPTGGAPATSEVRCRITVDKSKDHRPPPETVLQLEVRQVGEDSTLVISASETAKAHVSQRRFDESYLVSRLAHDLTSEDATSGAWQEACVRDANEKKVMGAATFKRLKKSLVESGYVEKSGGKYGTWTITEKGRERFNL